MQSSLSSNQEILAVASDVSSPAILLERGMRCIQQGYLVEGVIYFARAREELPPDQSHLAAVLDALIRCHARYMQAQRELLLTSKRLVEADAEQKTQLVALEKLLPAALREDMDREQQSPQLLQLPFAGSVREQLSPHTPSNDGDAPPELYITCFGRFEVRRMGRPIELCSSRNGRSILRYIVAKPGHYATSDSLQALLWPEDEPAVAQRKLHIAVSALRHSLSDGSFCNSGHSYIVCKNHVYYLDLAGTLQTDVDEFLSYYQSGQLKSDERIAYYEKACRLYTGPFLMEDIYADWSSLQREQLSNIYLCMCRVLADHNVQLKRYEDAIKWVTGILTENRCDEVAHQQLIRIYAAQGRRHEALQQYQRCERLLRDELGVEPLPETLLILQHLLATEDSDKSQG
jgi:DNA-binding SARP family transcriptional activator